MRKFVALIALVAVGVLSAVAYAQTQVNTYEVQGKASPAKGGTKKKPVPVAISASWQVGEESGLRPSVVDTYSIGFYGGSTNGKHFPVCTAAEINAAQSDEDCPSGARIGSGNITNDIGADANPSDRAIKCAVTHTIYNGGQGRAAIFIEGNPPTCPTVLAQAIDSRFIPAFGGKGTALRFSVPANLKHPIPGSSLALTSVTAKLPKKTTKVKGKTVGFFVMNQKCPRNKRAPIAFTFTSEAGQTVTEEITQTCRR